MSGASKAQKLREYFYSMPTLEDRIRAIVRYYNVIGSASNSTEEEEIAFYGVMKDTFYPIDNANAPEGVEPHIDAQKSF